MNRTYVICCNDFAGVHRWATQPHDAPHPYLKHQHRHRFTIETRFRVGHDDREIEIFDMEAKIAAWLNAKFKAADGVAYMGDTSCETLAREIANAFCADSCEVREDGRGGAVYARQ